MTGTQENPRSKAFHTMTKPKFVEKPPKEEFRRSDLKIKRRQKT
jgi:hypothetical protein